MIRHRVSVLWVAAVLMSASHAAAAPWEPFGPGGGAVLSIAVDPADAAGVYAVAGGTLYKSTDGGVAWKVLRGPGLSVVAVDPKHPSTVYAAGFNVLRSTDGGRTWSDVTPPGRRTWGFGTLALAPDGLVLAGEGPRLWRSGNAGQSWTLVSEDEVGIRSILIDPTDARRMIHASWRRVYKSTDAGEHWTAAASPVSDFISAVALAPSHPATLYLVAERVVFRSDDGAGSWRHVGFLPGGYGELALLVDPRSRERIYAADGSGIFTSGDGGRTWKEINRGLPRPFNEPLRISALALAASRLDTLYAGTSGWGVARSADAGARWRIGAETGLNAATVELLKFHPVDRDTVYLGLADQGTRSFRSTDGGRSWQPFARGVARDGLRDLAFDPDEPDTLYAGSGGGFWKSTDGGESWELIANESFTFVAALDDGALVGSACGLRRSTDGGRTWRQVIACLDGYGDLRRPVALWVDPARSGTLYVNFFVANGASRLGFQAFKSEDGGATWKPLRLPGGGLSQLAVAPGDFRVLYAVDPVRARLLRSQDGGQRWKVVTPNLPPGIDVLFGTMAVHAADPQTLYIGSVNGLLVSRDGGATLQRIDVPLEAARKDTSRVWTDRTRPGLVFASPRYDGGGLFVGRFE